MRYSAFAAIATVAGTLLAATPAFAVTTTENFNSLGNGAKSGTFLTDAGSNEWSSISGVTAGGSPDTYLQLSPGDDLTFKFTLAPGAWNISFSFYAASPQDVNATVSFSGTPGADPALVFLSTGTLNPGSGNGSFLYQSGTFSNIASGAHTFTLAGNSTGALRIDDFSMTATAVTPVPEPETYALTLVGLAIVGAVARRQRRG
jgi:hypothetical protein